MASDTPQPAASYPPFPAPAMDLTRPVMTIHHPGYADRWNTLLTFCKSDRSSAGTLGVHHQTVVIACQIIAGNVFNTGYLTTDRECQHRVDTPLHGILDKDKYYFTLGPDSPCQYHIVASFQDWEFPGQIPDSWPLLPYRPTPPPRVCSVSSLVSALDHAHLVPQKEYEWFALNRMSGYGSMPYVGNIHSKGNRCWLSATWHKVFDSQGFVIVPKIAPGATCAQYVTHFLSPQIGVDLKPTYHNIAVQYLDFDSRAFLFARFAWAIFTSVKSFIVAGNDRNVIQLVLDDGQDNITKFKKHRYEKVDQMSAESLDQKYGARPRGEKRKRQSGAEDDSMDSYTEGDSSGESASESDSASE